MRLKATPTLRSLPLLVAYGQIGVFAMIDCAEVGPLGTTPLAAAGFAINVLAPFSIFAAAGALALAPFIARAHDQDGEEASPEVARRLLVQCLRAQGAVAIACMAILGVLAGHLDRFGQPADVTVAARPYFTTMIASLLPIVVFAGLREYAIAMRASASAAVFAVVTIALKIALGAVLVGRLGLLGAAVATVIASVVGTLLFALDLARRGHLSGLGRSLGEVRTAPVFRNPLFSQGMSVSLQQLFELGAYYFAGIMAGWLGRGSLAAHSVGLNVANGAALLSLAVAQTTAAEVGRQARSGKALGAVWTGTATAFVAMAVVSITVVLTRRSLFSASPDHAALAWLVALSLVADGVQITLGGALRGLLDAKFFSVVSLACWWLFCLPVAYVLAFVLDLGIYGLWTALSATLFLCAILFAFRLVRRAHDRAHHRD